MSICGDTPALATHVPTTTLDQYQIDKLRLLDSIRSHPPAETGIPDPWTAIEKANQFVLERLKAADEAVSSNGIPFSREGNETASVARVERAVNELADIREERQRGGALGLLEGAGKL